jgi:hypothetical protein
MRADAGFVVAHLLLMLAGGALLYALRLVEPRPRRLLAALGPAYLTGIAAVVPVLILLLVIGIPFRTPVIVLVCLVEAAVFVVLGRRRPHARPSRIPLRTRIERIVLTVAATALGVWALWVAWAFAHLPIQLDDTRIWSLKSFALYYFDHLNPQVFDGGPYIASHLDYPILQPTLLAVISRLMGEISSGARHIALWIIVVAFLWTAAWLLARRLVGVVWLAPLVALAVAPALYTNVKLGYADAFYACFLALGALLLGEWIEERRPGPLVLAALMLGAAANGKNEGIVGAFVILLCAGAVAAAGPARRSALTAWAAATAGVVAMVAPWQIWIAAHDIHNTDQPGFGDAISPSYLGNQIDRLAPAAKRVLEQALSGWSIFLAGLIGVAIVNLIARRRTPLAAYYLAATLLLGLTVVFAYWTGTLPLEFQLDTSVDRTVTGTLVVAALGLAHLLGGESDDVAAAPQ